MQEYRPNTNTSYFQRIDIYMWTMRSMNLFETYHIHTDGLQARYDGS